MIHCYGIEGQEKYYSLNKLKLLKSICDAWCKCYNYDG